MNSNQVFTNKKIIAFLVFFFIAGALIKILSGIPVFQSNLIYSSGKKMKPPGTDTPSHTAVSFYMLIDSGKYEQAWEMALEPDWVSGGSDVSYFDEVGPGHGDFQGWTPKKEFVERLTGEIGKRGGKIRLSNYEAQDVSFQESEFEENTQYVKNFENVDFETIDKVEVRGHMLGACTIYKWDKELFVVKVDGNYRVLLSGEKQSRSLFYQSWFSDLINYGNIRGIKQ
jgi:hypothetical protein